MKEMIDKENEGTSSMGQFNPGQVSGFFYPRTFIKHDFYFIASDETSKIIFKSMEHDTAQIFQGAGSNECTQIMVKNNILYQACRGDGEKRGIHLYNLDQVDLSCLQKDDQ